MRCRAFQTKRAAGRNSVDEKWHGFGVRREQNKGLPKRPGSDQGRLEGAEAILSPQSVLCPGHALLLSTDPEKVALQGCSLGVLGTS